MSAAIEDLRRQIDEIYRHNDTPRLVGPDGKNDGDPRVAFHALKLVVEGMARRQAMTLVPHGKELTTQEAGDSLQRRVCTSSGCSTTAPSRTTRWARIAVSPSRTCSMTRAARGYPTKKLDESTRLSEEFPGGYRQHENVVAVRLSSSSGCIARVMSFAVVLDASVLYSVSAPPHASPRGRDRALRPTLERSHSR